MKKVLKDTASFRVLGLRQQFLAIAVCIGMGLGLSTPAEAAPARNTNPPALKASAPNVYVVKKGDTLWDISKKFLKNPYRWREIWASNRHVKNPHWIFPGDRLLMCTYNGKPIIGKDEGDGCAGIISRYTGDQRLQPQVRVESLDSAIPVIALDHIKQWLERSVILSAGTISDTPYIIGTADQRVLAAKGQTVYARGNGLTVGQSYGIYREAEPYTAINHKGKSYPIALELHQVATGVAVRSETGITTLELTETFNSEVRREDRVLPLYDPMLPTTFYPTYADEMIAGGEIIRVQGSIGTAGQHSTVTINRGRLQGLEAGHVLTVSQKGEVVTDPKTNERIQLPGQRIGEVMVFKTFDDFSYAYVLQSSLPIKAGASLVAPLMDD